jgi:hypothetical protein
MAVIENIKIEGDASQLIDALKELNKRVEDLEGQLQDTNKGVKSLGESSKGLGKGISAIGGSLKAIGIGVFIAAFDQLKEVFTGNQKVMDIFNTALNALKILFNDFAEAILPPVSNLLNSIFSDPVQSIKDFGSAIQDYVLNFFDQILSSVGHLGSALANLFTGDFAGALEQVKLAGADVVDAIVGVEEGGIQAIKNVAQTAFDYVKDLPSKIQEAVDAGKELVELEKAAQLAAVERQKIQLEYQRREEQLRQLRDDETKSIQERVKANADLLTLLEEQADKEREQMQIQVAFARAEYEKNKTTENLVALRQAELEIIDLSERLEGQRSEALSNQNSLMREQLDLQRSQQETAQEIYQIQEETSLELLDNEVARAQKEIEIAQNVFNKKKQFLEEQVALYAEGTQARVDAENELAILDAENASRRLVLEKTLQDAKVATIQQALSSIASLVGEQTAAGKALALAQVAIDTYTGATKALAQGGIFGYIGAAGIIASGIANARQITAVEVPNEPSTGGGATISNTLQAPSQAAQFNVVGQGGFNQLAESISQQNKQPTRAYVVGSDVTTSQELERKRIKTATFG